MRTFVGKNILESNAQTLRRKNTGDGLLASITVAFFKPLPC